MMDMESYVNCPKCGERVQVILKPYRDKIGGITVTASLHVTAEVNNGKG